MQAGKSQGSTAPTALGSMLQAATYGQTIPVVYGMTMSPLLAIWAANLRQGGSTKKFKQLKKGITAYVENIDFLLGCNPIMGVQQMWNNGGTIPLTFTSHSFTATQFGSGSFTIPDAHFYAVIGVTLVQNYSVTFNDYGGNGPVTLTGSYEVPLWNELQTGPDPTNPNSYRSYPNVYRWQPSYGAVVHVDGIPQGQVPLNPTVTTLKVYYSQLTTATSFLPPITKMRLAFEPELGSGTEYADAGLTAQQVIYPMYAGMGSSDLDLGSGGAIPQLQAEVQGKFGLYATGDADFADIIEDVFKSGTAQAAIGSGASYTQLEHGLSCYNLPGTVQKKVVLGFESSAGSTVTYNMPNTAGNVLVALIDVGDLGGTTVAPTISDSLGNTWVQAGTGTRTGVSFRWTLWYVVNCKSGANTITFTNATGFDFAQDFIILELAGVDTFDSISVQSGSAVNNALTTTNQQNLPELMLAISLQNGQTNPTASPGMKQLWPVTVAPFTGGDHDGPMFMQQRTVMAPGTYPLSWAKPASLPLTPSAASYMVMIGFKATNPASYPLPVGDFMDLASLNLVRLQCRANGLYGSLSMNAQQAASDWLGTLYDAADAAPVFLGFKLFSIPYSEVSAVGNGATYTAPTASGPVASLSDLNGDFVGSDVPIKVATSARVDQPNVLQMQCINRTSNYNPSLVEQPDAGSISLYGIRKEDPITNNAVQDVSIARQLLGIQVRKLQYGGDVYTFTMSAKWCLLAPMDLILITDTLASIINDPVRITEIVEQDDLSLQCKAEQFVYGMYAPTVFSTDQPVPYTPNPTGTAGNVNTPIFLEPVPRLVANQNQGQLWIVVSSANANYGGAVVYVSTDGGTSYNVLGDPIVGSATTGVTTADWPAGTDPDTTHNLGVDLTESNGSLLSYATADENNFLYPCFVAGGGQPIPYELMTYAVATLTAANKYTLMATGTGNSLRRGVFGAPVQGVGFDHPSGSRFAFLNPTGEGILKVNIDPTWIGKTLSFKICSFNSFGTSAQSLSDVTAVTYTPLGTSGQGVTLFQVNGA